MAKETPGYLGPYRLLNVVNTSHTSQIWQAYHDGQQQIVAIKALLPKFHRDREHCGYLQREYTVGRQVVHPRVIRVFCFDRDRGTPYVAMEWFPARNMKQWLLQGTEKIAHLLPKIVQQAAEGLAYFNQQGWVHRDIKPDNFLANEEGEVKLIDFAIARRERRGLSRLLAPRAKVQGTRSYMAPEQIRGSAPDRRADVYSFGCTVHELLSGKPPYTGVSANDLLKKHLKAPPPSLEAANSNVTPEFAQLVRRMLAKDPSARPESVEEFLQEFRMMRMFRVMPRPAGGGR